MTRDPAVLAHGIVDTDRHVGRLRRQCRAEGVRKQLGAEADLNQLTSLVENKDKLVFRMAKSWVLLKARSSEVRKQFVLCLSWGA